MGALGESHGARDSLIALRCSHSLFADFFGLIIMCGSEGLYIIEARNYGDRTLNSNNSNALGQAGDLDCSLPYSEKEKI